MYVSENVINKWPTLCDYSLTDEFEILFRDILSVYFSIKFKVISLSHITSTFLKSEKSTQLSIGHLHRGDIEVVSIKLCFLHTSKINFNDWFVKP